MARLWIFWMFSMLKKIGLLSFILISSNLWAQNQVDLYQAPIASLKQFSLHATANKTAGSINPSVTEINLLQQVNQTKDKQTTIARYQQLYKGIPVFDSQITITNSVNPGVAATSSAQVNGHLIKDIQLETTPALNADQALDLAKKAYFSLKPQAETLQDSTELQIRANEIGELKLVFLVSFKSVLKDEKPVWPFFVIDAQTGALLKQWNNLKTYHDSGPGGNEKVHQYWYGKDGLPFLDVTQKGSKCVMDNDKVKLINVNSEWDWGHVLVNPYEYICNKNVGKFVNGGYSPENDAYYFGHVIIDMYKNWYDINALQNPDGSAMKLTMRVHFGKNYDNAFWDGQSMSFGDGRDFYPLVSLDVAGHEVTHGFTDQHSGLEYYEQSGALNESLSDMAGQAVRAYLLETNPQLYNRAYLQPDQITWGIGETIMRDAFGTALRFMDVPSNDGYSADCLDKELAQSSGASCMISYPELVAFADSMFPDPEDKQSFIVHTASGVFNKAFYLLSQNLGIKKANEMMILANTKYWTPATDFKQGACGVIYAGKELQIDTSMIKSVFAQVGVETSGCAL